MKNSHYSFPTRDAINYATDAAGTIIEPSKVKVSRAEVSSSKKESYRVSYSYGKAHAQTVVQVRANAREGIVKATKNHKLETVLVAGSSTIRRLVIGAEVLRRKLNRMF